MSLNNSRKEEKQRGNNRTVRNSKERRVEIYETRVTTLVRFNAVAFTAPKRILFREIFSLAFALLHAC